MTDRQTLLEYRIKQGEATLADAEKMLAGGLSPRSIVNRAYYATFYSALALFLHADLAVRTSKHSGVIAIFDKEFISSGKLDKRLSRNLHALFDDRQEFDYKELVEVSQEDAAAAVDSARDFIESIIKYIRA
jgi:uncharacterized protein (UPF0332 family)